MNLVQFEWLAELVTQVVGICSEAGLGMVSKYHNCLLYQNGTAYLYTAPPP